MKINLLFVVLFFLSQPKLLWSQDNPEIPPRNASRLHLTLKQHFFAGLRTEFAPVSGVVSNSGEYDTYCGIYCYPVDYTYNHTIDNFWIRKHNISFDIMTELRLNQIGIGLGLQTGFLGIRPSNIINLHQPEFDSMEPRGRMYVAARYVRPFQPYLAVTYNPRPKFSLQAYLGLSTRMYMLGQVSKYYSGVFFSFWTFRELTERTVNKNLLSIGLRAVLHSFYLELYSSPQFFVGTTIGYTINTE